MKGFRSTKWQGHDALSRLENESEVPMDHSPDTGIICCLQSWQKLSPIVDVDCRTC